MSNFPPLPDYQAEGTAIYMEPIAASGERLCVAVAAIGADNRFDVVLTIRESTARCMLGEAGPRFMNMVQLVRRSLLDHLQAGGDFTDWHPPMAGVHARDPEVGHVTDLTMMLRTMARNSAFLSSMADFVADEDVVRDPRASDRWVQQVKDQVILKQPGLEGNFGQTLKLVERGSKTRFDYVGGRYCAQLSKVVPGSNFSTYTRIAKSKLWDLVSLRDIGHESLLHPESFELILYRPKDSDPSFNESEIQRVNEAFLELEAEGDRQALRVLGVHSAEKAAERIIVSDAA